MSFSMTIPKPQPVESVKNLGERVDRLLKSTSKRASYTNQLGFDSLFEPDAKPVAFPTETIASFLNFVTDAIPDGDIYLFGGVLRDLALLGQRGFNSDVDLVVEGSWEHFISYLESLGANKNKFGGYRLSIGEMPVDIWHAEETWAIKQGLVAYKGIASLTETTVLNWDAILMNWRTRTFIYRKNYFEEVYARALDVVLEENPNPLGMAVRVLRHLSLKDARKISARATRYLMACTRSYSFEAIHDAEVSSYRNAVIERNLYRFFEAIDVSGEKNLQRQFDIAADVFHQELGLQ